MGMSDLEKVIKGLEQFISDFKPYCGNDADWKRVFDALELIKAQEPRVLTVEEVIKHYSLPPAFPDDLAMQEDYYEDIQPLYFDFPYDDEDPWIIHWRGHAHVARYLDEWKHTYGVKWRCWSAKPSDAERKAVAWND